MISILSGHDGSVLGKNIGMFKVKEFNEVNGDGVYYRVNTGVSDYIGDEIILTVWPEKNIVTDEGYTEFLLESDERSMNIVDARLFIESSGVELTNTYNAHLVVHYEKDGWEEAVKVLTACIIDTYAILLSKYK